MRIDEDGRTAAAGCCGATAATARACTSHIISDIHFNFARDRDAKCRICARALRVCWTPPDRRRFGHATACRRHCKRNANPNDHGSTRMHFESIAPNTYESADGLRGIVSNIACDAMRSLLNAGVSYAHTDIQRATQIGSTEHFTAGPPSTNSPIALSASFGLSLNTLSVCRATQK